MPEKLSSARNIFLVLQTFNLFVTSKNETTNSPIHKFKVLQNVFKMKKQGLKCFKNKKWYTTKKGVYRLSGL